MIFNWLQGLNEITLDYTPLLENNSYFDPANQVVLKYPLAIVNVKSSLEFLLFMMMYYIPMRNGMLLFSEDK